jgi:hypothetical protein
MSWWPHPAVLVIVHVIRVQSTDDRLVEAEYHRCPAHAMMKQDGRVRYTQAAPPTSTSQGLRGMRVPAAVVFFWGRLCVHLSLSLSLSVCVCVCVCVFSLSSRSDMVASFVGLAPKHAN